MLQHRHNSSELELTAVGDAKNPDSLEGDRYITNMFSAKETPGSDGNVVIATQRGVTVVNDIQDEEELGVNYLCLFDKDDVFCKHRVYKVAETTILSI